MILNFRSLRTYALASTLVLAACASKKPEYYQALAPSSDPSAELATLNTDIEAAKAKQSDVLAPDFFTKSLEQRAEAEKLRAHNKDNEKILEAIAESKAYLKKANILADVSRVSVAPIVEARQKAISANATASQEAALNRADANFKKFTHKVESGKINLSEKDRNGLEEEYRAIELRAITHNYIGSARGNIDVSEKEGAEKVAPKMWKAANEKYAAAESVIMNDRYNEAKIRPLANDAVNSGAILLKTVRYAKVAKKMSPEELALYSQKQENDLKMTQQESEAQKAARMAQEKELNDKNSKLTGFEANARIDAKIAEVRKDFSTDEADVFKDGNNVLIRLKKISFKKNDASLRPEQIQVLAKVQRAVAEFSPQKIVVEGHTDSTGGAVLNKALSEERAKVVQSYLVNNGAVEETKIETVGYGFEKPLATNKTAAGRAQNRRIDVLIEL